MICNNCGAQIDDGAGYCPNCGMYIVPNEMPINMVPEMAASYEMPYMSTEKKDIKKKWTKKKKIITGIIIAVALAVVVLAAVVLRFLLLPQTQVVTAFANTMYTATESGINKKYGGYDMAFSMALGNYDVELVQNTDDNVKLTQGVRRNKSENDFLTFCEYEDKNEEVQEKLSVYADKNTSVIGYSGSMLGELVQGDSYSEQKEFSIQIDYADDMETKLGNSFISQIGLDKETIHTISKIYVDLMEAATGTAQADNVVDGLYTRTKDYFLNLESEKCDKQTFTINGKETKCRVYKIVFDAKDTAEYIEDCYNMSCKTGEKVDEFLEKITGYTLQELFDEINEKADSLENLDVYFAVNNKQQLVSIYCKNVSENNINMELNFYGGEYLCDNVEFKYSDDTGKELVITKDDISKGDRLEVEYTCNYREDKTSEKENVKLSYAFENDQIYVACEDESGREESTAKITDYKKGKYIELEMEDASMYIGSQVKEISMPEYKNTLNLLDSDMMTVYSFFSDIFSK
ncbi:MAG: zinc ribbon domain-containing protein [Coprococcus sp.]